MKNEIDDMTEFLAVYTTFDKWLGFLGFKHVNSSSIADYHFSVYDKYVDSLYGIEHYAHDILGLSIRFIRDRNEHKFLFLDSQDELPPYKTISIEDMRTQVLDLVRKTRDEKLAALNTLQDI